jgi:hypothetical protein
MTRPCWTPNGTEEVTVNIFTLHAMHLVFNQRPLIERIIKQRLNESALANYAANNFSFNEW